MLFSSSLALRDLPSFPTRRSSDLIVGAAYGLAPTAVVKRGARGVLVLGEERVELPARDGDVVDATGAGDALAAPVASTTDRKSTRLNSSHVAISYAVFCLKKKRIQ